MIASLSGVAAIESAIDANQTVTARLKYFFIGLLWLIGASLTSESGQGQCRKRGWRIEGGEWPSICGDAIVYPREADYGSGSGPARAGSTGGAVDTGDCDGGGFMTGMKGGFDEGSRVDGGDARSTTVISPAAWERYSATSI